MSVVVLVVEISLMKIVMIMLMMIMMVQVLLIMAMKMFFGDNDDGDDDNNDNHDDANYDAKEGELLERQRSRSCSRSQSRRNSTLVIRFSFFFSVFTNFYLFSLLNFDNFLLNFFSLFFQPTQFFYFIISLLPGRGGTRRTSHAGRPPTPCSPRATGGCSTGPALRCTRIAAPLLGVCFLVIGFQPDCFLVY